VADLTFAGCGGPECVALVGFCQKVGALASQRGAGDTILCLEAVGSHSTSAPNNFKMVMVLSLWWIELLPGAVGLSEWFCAGSWQGVGALATQGGPGDTIWCPEAVGALNWWFELLPGEEGLRVLVALVLSSESWSAGC
jgi:hypothetical protein